MSSTINEANGTVANRSDAKQAWATPSIESYDVAAFTLGAGGNAGDLDASHS